jgi:hypothetical protein
LSPQVAANINARIGLIAFRSRILVPGAPFSHLRAA